MPAKKGIARKGNVVHKIYYKLVDDIRYEIVKYLSFADFFHLCTHTINKKLSTLINKNSKAWKKIYERDFGYRLHYKNLSYKESYINLVDHNIMFNYRDITSCAIDKGYISLLKRNICNDYNIHKKISYHYNDDNNENNNNKDENNDGSNYEIKCPVTRVNFIEKISKTRYYDIFKYLYNILKPSYNELLNIISKFDYKIHNTLIYEGHPENTNDYVKIIKYILNNNKNYIYNENKATVVCKLFENANYEISEYLINNYYNMITDTCLINFLNKNNENFKLIKLIIDHYDNNIKTINDVNNLKNTEDVKNIFDKNVVLKMLRTKNLEVTKYLIEKYSNIPFDDPIIKHDDIKYIMTRYCYTDDQISYLFSMINFDELTQGERANILYSAKFKTMAILSERYLEESEKRLCNLKYKISYISINNKLYDNLLCSLGNDLIPVMIDYVKNNDIHITSRYINSVYIKNAIDHRFNILKIIEDNFNVSRNSYVEALRYASEGTKYNLDLINYLFNNINFSKKELKECLKISCSHSSIIFGTILYKYPGPIDIKKIQGDQIIEPCIVEIVNTYNDRYEFINKYKSNKYKLNQKYNYVLKKDAPINFEPINQITDEMTDETDEIPKQCQGTTKKGNKCKKFIKKSEYCYLHQ